MVEWRDGRAPELGEQQICYRVVDHCCVLGMMWEDGGVMLFRAAGWRWGETLVGCRVGAAKVGDPASSGGCVCWGRR